MGYKIAVVGATGLVGQTIIKVIEELNLPVSDLIPVASARSQGKTVRFRGKTIKVVDANTAISKEPKVAIFSAGASVSRKLAPQFADAGIIVIDNSSAWRMDENVPLVVPEVNASQILKKHKIIANPNCSTIQMVVALHPLHKAYNLKRVIVSTYQSVTGSGIKGAQQLDDERAGRVANGP
ncbi:MAG TPA: aspartate-semialdehyde dehydrogenase, partial [Bacteroidales bacterium]|nr:aspartate-semialdehyde dehydrogenase [Bacteroidales bacterium]